MPKGSKRTIGLPGTEEAESMAEFLCQGCNDRKVIQITVSQPADILHGVMECSKCGRKTVFVAAVLGLKHLPSYQYGTLPLRVDKNVARLFTEAESSFYAPAPCAALAMCRACLEKALALRQITQGTLEAKIAKAQSLKILDATHVALAHGSRLVGNAALHDGDTVPIELVPSMLVATVQLVNALA